MSIRLVGTPDDPANWVETICMLAPMGTSYVRPNPLSASVDVEQGQSLTIDHIEAETGFEITNVLNI